MKKRSVFAILGAFVLFISFILISIHCQMEKVSPNEPTKIPIAEILEKISVPTSVANAEEGIKELFSKVGFNKSFPGNKYEGYGASREQISQLAENQIIYLTDDITLTMGDIFDETMDVANQVGLPQMTYEAVTVKLHNQISAALSEPEIPENALLVVIAAKDKKLPKSVHNIRRNTRISPVQAILYSTWLHSEFASLGNNTASIGTWFCVKKCFFWFRLCRLNCWIHDRWDPPTFHDCMNDCRQELNQCLRECHDQGGVN